MKYRPIAVEVDAVQWTGSNAAELTAFAGSDFAPVGPEDRGDDPEVTGEVLTTAHSTWTGLYDGDWVIRGVTGDLFVCSKADFGKTYEPVTKPGAGK